MKIFKKGHKKRIIDMAFSPDGKLLASASMDSTVRLWDTETGEGDIFIEGENSSYSPFERVAFTREGQHLAVRSNKYGLQIWDIAGRTCLKTFLQNPSAIYRGGLAASRQGHLLAANQWIPNPFQSLIHLWDTKSYKKTVLYKTSMNIGLGALAFDPAGTKLATSRGIFDTATGELLVSTENFYCEAMRWSANSAYIGTSHYSTAVHIYKSDTIERIFTAELPLKYVQSFDFSPDSRFLVLVSNEEIVRIWDLISWSEREGFAWGIGKLKCLTFAPDGQRVACANERGKILLWDWDLD